MSSAAVESLEPAQFPTIRFAFALALTFFPIAVLYPLGYPERELVTITFWIVTFPSSLLSLAVASFALFAATGYEFYAYNLYCVTATLGLALTVAKRPAPNIAAPLNLARACVLLTVLIAAWQTLSPDTWLHLFTDLQGLGDARGAGLRAEPSYLAAPVALYLALLVHRLYTSAIHRPLLLEAVFALSAVLSLTRSLSVLIVVLCFVPALARRPLHGALSGLALGIAGITLYDRIAVALSDASGDPLSLITTSTGSWRNIPDIAILANYKAYLLPGSPSTVREQLNAFASAWAPGFTWLENTFSTFSGSAVTLGLLFTAFAFLGGLFLGLKRMAPLPANLRFAWLLLYCASWFFLPKFEASSWIALALLATAAPTPNRVTHGPAALLSD